jgi:hypothetical protein
MSTPKRIDLPIKGKFYEFRFKIGDVECPPVHVTWPHELTPEQRSQVEEILIGRLRQKPTEAIGPFSPRDGDFAAVLKAFERRVNPRSALEIALEYGRQQFQEGPHGEDLTR